MAMGSFEPGVVPAVDDAEPPLADELVDAELAVEDLADEAEGVAGFTRTTLPANAETRDSFRRRTRPRAEDPRAARNRLREHGVVFERGARRPVPPEQVKNLNSYIAPTPTNDWTPFASG